MTDNPSPQEMAEKARRDYQSGDYLEAARGFGEAAKLFVNSGDPSKTAEMKNNQSVALLLSGEAQAALDVVEGTHGVFATSGDLKLQGMALVNQATALEALRRSQAAEDYYERAAAILADAKEGDLRATVMLRLTWLYLRHFKLYDALIALQSGLAGAKNLTKRQRLMKKLLFTHL